MHFQSDGTQVSPRPAPAAVNGTPGYVQAGNAATGAIPSDVDPDLTNALMDEIANVVVAAGIALDKTNNAQLLAAIPLVAVGRLLRIDPVVVSGALPPPPHYSFALVELQGAGGGGGGSPGTGPGNAAAAGGGSAGTYERGVFSKAQITAQLNGNGQLPFTIGAGGAGGGANSNGADGVASQVGNLMSAPAGRGGAVGYNTASTAIVAGGPQGAPGAGGNLAGSQGEDGAAGLVLNATAAYFGCSGRGGGSQLAAGGGAVGANTNGTPGGIGAGGSGACSGNNGAGYTGGNGGAGYASVWWFA